MVVKQDLTVNVEPDKRVVHFEFDLSGSGITYVPGDALGVYPLNHPMEVDDLIRAARLSGDAEVFVPNGIYGPAPETPKILLKHALTKYCDLKTVKPELLKELRANATVSTADASRLDELLEGGLSLAKNARLAEYVKGREVRDVLRDFKSCKMYPEILMSKLKLLAPRYYSISSSPNDQPGRVSITVAVLRYATHGIDRTGVCSTFLGERFDSGGGAVPVFVNPAHDFRLPTEGSKDIIMVGPGTGLAPFRAFLQEV
jgi:sulfite reductase (NADPH) flavoprotein alpha-component